MYRKTTICVSQIPPCQPFHLTLWHNSWKKWLVLLNNSLKVLIRMIIDQVALSRGNTYQAAFKVESETQMWTKLFSKMPDSCLKVSRNEAKGACCRNLKYTMEIFTGFNTVCKLIPYFKILIYSIAIYGWFQSAERRSPPGASGSPPVCPLTLLWQARKVIIFQKLLLNKSHFIQPTSEANFN